MTRPDQRRQRVVADTADLLEALAAPFGTYFGVATCRPVPGAKTLDGIVADLLWGLGKTEVLTRPGRATVEVAESWLRAHDVRHLLITGADALAAAVWVELCQLGVRVGCDIVFVSAQPSRWAAQLPEVLECGSWTYLVADPDRHELAPPVGAALPDVGFPGLPAACAELLDADHAPRAQAIYDDCLTVAFEALPSDRMFGWAAAEYAFRCALERTPDLDAVPLAMHALRAAGLLRGYHIDFRTDRGVAFDDLLTADRLAQLRRLVSTRQAGAGVIAGMPQGGSMRDRQCGRLLHQDRPHRPRRYRPGPTAAVRLGPDRRVLGTADDGGSTSSSQRPSPPASVAQVAARMVRSAMRADRLPGVPSYRRPAHGLDQAPASAPWPLTPKRS